MFKRRWKATWVAILLLKGVSVRGSCGGQISLQKGESVDISSPGFEKHTYPADALCSWKINAAPGRKLSVSFQVVSLWPSSQCILDGLVLLDGEFPSSPHLATFCAGTPSSDVVTRGPKLLIVFYTSGLPSPFFGFLLHVRDIEPDPICKRAELRCRNKNCVQKKLICDGKDDCGDGTDEEQCGHLNPRPVACGVPLINQSGDRIVGGGASVPGSWPWQGSLRRRGRGHVCGAVLVRDQWALTAAHCFTGFKNTSLWTIHFGKYYKESNEPTEQVRYIRQILIHPRYSKVTLIGGLNRKDCDIALIRFNAPVTMTEYVRPVCLAPWLAQVNPGTICYVTGWGETRGTGYNDVLKQATIPIKSQENCQKSYNSISISRKMICAGYDEGGRDSCKGDSGGPLVVQKKGQWFLVGVVSTGGECAAPGQPGIYTRISSFKPWIASWIDR
ncbi:hypothetical protein JTE90_005584 [Oedothorax gibbosus]|uniref:Uncharacterized protein n=1 Tax=Oedothorax gibbosus TaxID=931172 RepID=A0AAV6V9X4_9ARAC|nr:hypothetical protein JTE90_005584 [Oedothorax gibbosus]